MQTYLNQWKVLYKKTTNMIQIQQIISINVWFWTYYINMWQVWQAFEVYRNREGHMKAPVILLAWIKASVEQTDG